MNEAYESPEEANLRKHIYFVVMDDVIGELTVRFSAAKQISDTFSFPWNYKWMSKVELKRKAAKLAEKYSKEIISKDHVQEMNHTTMVHKYSFGRKQIGALEPLNSLAEYRLESIFPNLNVSLRMFLTAPVTVASAERSFSKLKLNGNYPNSTMDQDHRIIMARLSIESDIGKITDFDTVIRSYTKKKTPRQSCFT